MPPAGFSTWTQERKELWYKRQTLKGPAGSKEERKQAQKELNKQACKDRKRSAANRRKEEAIAAGIDPEELVSKEYKVYLDELDLGDVFDTVPFDSGLEVFAFPVPDGEISEWLAPFEGVDTVTTLKHNRAQHGGDRAYIKFKDHASARLFVDRGAGSWSRSERFLGNSSCLKQVGPRVQEELKNQSGCTQMRMNISKHIFFGFKGLRSQIESCKILLESKLIQIIENTGTHDEDEVDEDEEEAIDEQYEEEEEEHFQHPVQKASRIGPSSARPSERLHNPYLSWKGRGRTWTH